MTKDKTILVSPGDFEIIMELAGVKEYETAT